MNQQTLLKKIIMMARTGDGEAFENLYILTVRDTYGKLRLSVREPGAADEILVNTYVMLYRRVHELPAEEAALEERIEQEIRRMTYKRLGLEIERFDRDYEYPDISEDKAAALWLRIEDKAGLSREEETRQKNYGVGIFLGFVRIVAAVAMLCAAVLVIYKGVDWIQDGRKAKTNAAAATQEETHESSQPDIKIEKELQESGWERKPDGKLYYVRRDGTLADSSVPIGKQILTFAATGELTLIGGNREVSEYPNLSFDEDVRYEVRDGDIYRKDPAEGGAEAAVTKNGHVVQADYRNGHLWYICKYQIPNTDQIKTTIYRANPDGEKEEEIYSTNSTLNTENFQLTSEWLYYTSDGMLLRKNLGTDAVELMAEQVEYYFAWEDTVYYMRDRTLEIVSQGIDYAGIESGYKIERRDGGFVLLDAVGEPVIPDESGEKELGDRIYKISNGLIASVRPAVREKDGVTYYIETAGSDRKIYSKNSSGTQALIRQDGLAADSLCIAGDWLYYSARTAIYGGEVESRIYRLNLNTLESESVGNAFRGYMANLYYFDNLQTIFGEYIPSAADPHSIQGEIAVIPVGGEPRSLNDTGDLPGDSDSYLLELVMADGNTVFCLYHELAYNEETGRSELLSSEPMEIELR